MRPRGHQPKSFFGGLFCKPQLGRCFWRSRRKLLAVLAQPTEECQGHLRQHCRAALQQANRGEAHPLLMLPTLLKELMLHTTELLQRPLLHALQTTEAGNIET